MLPNRQYRVRVNGSGRVTLRNRRFLRVSDQSVQTGSSLISPGLATSSDALTIPLAASPDVPPQVVIENERATGPDPEALEQEFVGPTADDSPVAVRRLPKALRYIADFNSRGLRQASRDLQGRLRGGR